MKNMKHRLLSAALLLFGALGTLTSAFAQITPSQDSHTNTASPATNFGNAATLEVVNSATSIQTTYIKFDLSSVPAGYSSANVAKATLKLFVSAVPSAGSFNVDVVNGSWTEKTITASLSPALGSTIASSIPLTSANVHDYILIDVTSAVGDWLNGFKPNDGIALVANSPLAAAFDSKENAAQSHPAELDIIFTAGGTITGVTTGNGSGLTGGGASGTLNLGLLNTCSANQVLEWNGSAWVCASVGTGTISSVSAGIGLTGGGAGGAVTLNLDTTQVPLLNAANTFNGNQAVKGSISVNDTNGSLAAGSFAGGDLGAGGGGFGLLVTGGRTTAGPGGTAIVASGGLGGTSGTGDGGVGIAVQGGNAVTPGGLAGTGNGGVGITAQGGVALGIPGVGGTGGIFVGGTGPVGGAASGGDGIHTTGADSSTSGAGNGINATGGNSQVAPGVGLFSVGGTLLAGFSEPGLQGGSGGVFAGGQSTSAGSPGGFGIQTTGGSSTSGIGGVGIWAIAGGGTNGVGKAGLFTGDVLINGNLQVSGTVAKGGGSFKIDHPLNPANQYLSHSFVESPDMMNIYNGNVMTDARGHAEVALPGYFEALNQDFRYQLTVIGQFAQAVVEREIKNNRFTIRTNKPGVKVSWQVTGIRHDIWANSHRVPVEAEKPEAERGYFLNPELYGAPEEKSIERAHYPATKKQMTSPQAKATGQSAAAKP
jgi:hypothetical protein